MCLLGLTFVAIPINASIVLKLLFFEKSVLALHCFPSVILSKEEQLHSRVVVMRL